jgi:hypothetical protein
MPYENPHSSRSVDQVCKNKGIHQNTAAGTKKPFASARHSDLWEETPAEQTTFCGQHAGTCDNLAEKMGRLQRIKHAQRPHWAEIFCRAEADPQSKRANADPRGSGLKNGWIWIESALESERKFFRTSL